MKKQNAFLVNLLFLSVVFMVILQCKKEEIVIVYSEISTVGSSSITSMSADVEGNIEELTETTHNEYGVCWNTQRNPTVYDQKGLAGGTAVTGSFTVRIDGLTPSTTYYARAFVLDNKKYVYGSEISFTTSAANLPEVSTSYVTGITSRYAYSGGYVSEEGDKPVIARGVCFDTISSPTIHKNKTIDGWGTGSFTSALTNLKSSKEYYVRAYAMSEFGVSYGSEESFTTDPAVFKFHDDFENNDNDWFTGQIDNGGNISVEDGEYVMKYSQEGYMWFLYNDFPGLLSKVSDRDFEITAMIKHTPFELLIIDDELLGGLVWDSDDENFKFFGVLRRHKRGISDPSSSEFYYIIGNYDGSFTTWKTYTQFTGEDYNKLSIKKGDGYYYFFINDVQIHKQSYPGLTREGVGFFVQNATMRVDWLTIEQKGDKKSGQEENIEWMSPAKGEHTTVRSINFN
ncbi:MAG: hypothetical protein R6U58_09370 [Bacteroidales bacterium]